MCKRMFWKQFLKNILCIRTGANTGPTCIGSEINSLEIVSWMYWVPGGKVLKLNSLGTWWRKIMSLHMSWMVGVASLCANYGGWEGLIKKQPGKNPKKVSLSWMSAPPKQPKEPKTTAKQVFGRFSAVSQPLFSFFLAALRSQDAGPVSCFLDLAFGPSVADLKDCKVSPTFGGSLSFLPLWNKSW